MPRIPFGHGEMKFELVVGPALDIEGGYKWAVHTARDEGESQEVASGKCDTEAQAMHDADLWISTGLVDLLTRAAAVSAMKIGEEDRATLRTSHTPQDDARSRKSAAEDVQEDAADN